MNSGHLISVMSPINGHLFLKQKPQFHVILLEKMDLDLID